MKEIQFNGVNKKIPPPPPPFFFVWLHATFKSHKERETWRRSRERRIILDIQRESERERERERERDMKRV